MCSFRYEHRNEVYFNSTTKLKKLSRVDGLLTSAGTSAHTRPLQTNPAGRVTTLLKGKGLSHRGFTDRAGEVGKPRWPDRPGSQCQAWRNGFKTPRFSPQQESGGGGGRRGTHSRRGQRRHCGPQGAPRMMPILPAQAAPGASVRSSRARHTGLGLQAPLGRHDCCSQDPSLHCRRRLCRL